MQTIKTNLKFSKNISKGIKQILEHLIIKHRTVQYIKVNNSISYKTEHFYKEFTLYFNN